MQSALDLVLRNQDEISDMSPKKVNTGIDNYRLYTNTAITAIGIILALVSYEAHAQTSTGRVTGISDGDTLTLLDTTEVQLKIRLSGIDSPEKGQSFGQYCKKSLSDLVYGRVVQIDWKKLDRYGRIIGTVLVDEQDVNLEQVRRGCGWHYKKYQNDQSIKDRLRYSAAEEFARKEKVGLWADIDPIPPWIWRSTAK